MAGRFTGPRGALVALLCASTLTLAGCPKDPYDPDTWIGKLDDPGTVDEAVSKLADLKCPEAIAPLGAAWRKHSKSSTMLRAIIAIADQPAMEKGANSDCPDAPAGPYWQEATPILIEAVEDVDTSNRRAIEDAVVAADALGRAKDPEAVQALISAATRKMPKLSEGQRVRLAAVRALGEFGSNARAVDTLIAILNTDPDEQPPQLNGAAANALAVTGSEKAVEPLIVALFELAPIYPQVRNALTRVGKPAVSELIKVFKGEHPKVEEIAKKNGFATDCGKAEGPGSTCIAPGNVTFKAAAILGDLRAKEAVPVLAAELGTPAKVSFFDPRTGAPGPADHNAILDALRNIGSADAAEAVYNYMRADSTDDLTRPIAIDVYSMITRDTKALDWLEKLFTDGEQEEQIRSAAALAYARLVRKKDELAPIQKVIDRQLSEAKASDAKAAKAKNDDDKANAEAVANDYRGFAREYEQHKTRAQVGILCGDDPACYADLIKSDSAALMSKLSVANHRAGEMKKQDQAFYRIAALERALLELAKLGEKARGSLPALLKHVDSTERIIRQGVLLAMVQVAPTPCPECVARLNEVITEQETQTTLDLLTADTKVVRNYFEAGDGSGSAAAPPQ